MPTTPVRPSGDAFGRALLAWTGGATELEVYERDDGFVEAGPGPEVYLADFDTWPSGERRAVRRARGRVLDVGCGAGRVALHLQNRGHEVVGLDSSPAAVRAAARRGVKQVQVGQADDVEGMIAGFDTVVLYGNNFGIFGSPARLHATLARWARRSQPGTRLLAGSTDPRSGQVPALDRDYQRCNRAKGRMAGDLRLRIRFGADSTPFFRWLFVSPAEMTRLLRGTGWQMTGLEEGRADAGYVAVLERS